MGEAWKIVLEISTLLGGLAAVVFFYDRYKQQQSATRPKSSPKKGKVFWSRVGALICLGVCALLDIAFVKYGEAAFACGPLGEMVLTFVLLFFLMKAGLEDHGIYDAIAAAGFTAFVGSMFGVFVVLGIYRWQGGDENANLAGTAVSYFAAILASVASILFYYTPVAQVGFDLMD